MGKRILIVNVNWVGDVLFSTPFIRAVREAYPDSYIAALIHPRTKEVLEGNPRLDELIVYDEEFRHSSLLGKFQLIKYLKKKHFDSAFILHRSFTKAVITYLAGIKERTGYATKNRALFLTKALREPSGGMHKVESFLNIARAIGIKPKDNSYEYFVSDLDKARIKDFLKNNGVGDKDIIVVLCPGGNWDPKRWPKNNFAKLADILTGKFSARIVIAGAKKDINLAQDISGMMKYPPVIAAGKTTLKELGALFSRADLVVANDTGPMHMAVAMKAKTIALFGPTSPEITGPYGSGNYRVVRSQPECGVPCYDNRCLQNLCMDAIKVEDVSAAACEMLKEK